MNGVEASLVAFAVAVAMSPLALAVLKGRVVDVPNQRSSHTVPTPRGGGIVLIVAVTVGLMIVGTPGSATTAALMTAVLLGGIGLAEDIRGLRVGLRLGLQTAAGLTGAFWLLNGLEIPPLLSVMAGAVAVFWLVGFTNVFNFMDGINGVGAAQLIVAGVAWAAVGELTGQVVLEVPAMVTVGAALGFLPWNFPRARFFMGDVGSYFSGGWLASMALIGISRGVPVGVMVGPLLIFGVDTTFTLMKRIQRGEDWRSPHRSHIYQQLVVGGWSHSKVTAFYAVLATGTTFGGMLYLVGSPALTVLGTFVAGGVVLLYLTSPRLFVRATPLEK